MSSWNVGEYDWENPIFIKKREELAEFTTELDEYFDEVRADNHEGGCWDLINKLAMLLTEKERQQNETN